MASRILDVLFTATTRAVGFLGNWWDSSCIKKQSLSPPEGQEEERLEKKPPARVPHRQPTSSNEKWPRSGRVATLLLTTSSSSSERRKMGRKAWVEEMVGEEARRVRQNEHLQKWWRELERNRVQEQMEKFLFQRKGQRQEHVDPELERNNLRTLREKMEPAAEEHRGR